ncbi:MAG TPA: hypothetical protein GXZ91_08780 [Christensenellaceae bacterium]|nr:hypothetical protein [Christensenellaceae bacterium]
MGIKNAISAIEDHRVVVLVWVFLLYDYLQNRVFVSSSAVTLKSDGEIAEGFEWYLTSFKNALAVEQAAINKYLGEK